MIEIKDRLALLRRKGVVGVKSGKKVTAGVVSDIDCVTVLVIKKLPKAVLAKKDLVPETVSGIITDVVESGVIKAFKARTDKWNPAPGGVSIAHYLITAGTLGVLVRDGKSSKNFILSNNHVLANSNDASPGDIILQPGPYDGGTAEDAIANLVRFVEIGFTDAVGGCPISNTIAGVLNVLARFIGSSDRMRVVKQEVVNTVDAALAEPLAPDLVSNDILDIGRVNGCASSHSVGMEIQKSGRTTELTQGTIEATDLTALVQYGEGKSAIFTDQLQAGAMSGPGDSGSLVVDMENRAVGLLFAGSDTLTIINPISAVLEQLDIEI